ncbi:hypothetical protein SELMODRAFT_409621 [Selaginella moellendorffii]|uniref:Clathrin light chain n=1 Tax=Selaginella moellendorffii TaxID=88036 RepID=D8RDH3_SELML|nr:hypothetical protein SELMODRAFT_409621 [Selaginella moellendorffii]
MLPGFPTVQVQVEHEPDILLDVRDTLDIGYHADTFNYMAPPSPASPFETLHSCTHPRSPVHGSAELGTPVKKLVEQALKERQNFYARRKAEIEKTKEDNRKVLLYTKSLQLLIRCRSKEKGHIAAFKMSRNDWKAVASIIDLTKHLTMKDNRGNMIDIYKAGTSKSITSRTDLARMHQVLLKLNQSFTEGKS